MNLQGSLSRQLMCLLKIFLHSLYVLQVIDSSLIIRGGTETHIDGQSSLSPEKEMIRGVARRLVLCTVIGVYKLRDVLTPLTLISRIQSTEH